MIRAAFVIVFAFAALVIAFDYGREYERARVMPPPPCPKVDRIKTYSTEEIARILKTRRRMESVK
jgi:hypothetical protein